MVVSFNGAAGSTITYGLTVGFPTSGGAGGGGIGTANTHLPEEQLQVEDLSQQTMVELQL